jgi:hypothetical protein
VLNLGAVTSGPAVEKFDTAAFTRLIESLPEASCTAKFVARESGVGAAYDTVTVLPNSIAVPIVSWTVLPETTAALGWKSTPLIVTVYADAGAFLARSASSYDKVSKVPVEFVTADVKIGARKSGATDELLVAEKFETDNMSLPVLS